MTVPRIALSIRAQLLLVLTVFLALPWLGVEYVRELERVLRDAQERTLAGTAQAVATALHDRPRLFAAPPDPIAPFARERGNESTARLSRSASPPSASPEVAQIIDGLSRTTARIWVIDRGGNVLARAGTLKSPPDDAPDSSLWARVSRATVGRLYALVLDQPSEDFADDAAAGRAPGGRDVEGALAGILTTDRRPTSDAKAVIVSAAHPIWVGDMVKGAVIVEETGNAVLAQRNHAFERLFNIVLAVLLGGSLALTLYATWLSSRIRRLRDDAERAIDEHGRVRVPLASSNAGDEIGDLSRSFASVLARLSDYADYQQKMASRLSHELRTPIAVVRSSLDNLKQAALPDDARVYMVRAQEGLARLTTILTRMTEAARLEQSLSDVEREHFDLSTVVAGCVDGYAQAYPGVAFAFARPASECVVYGAPDLIAQMLDKLVANAVEFGRDGGRDGGHDGGRDGGRGAAVEVGLARAGEDAVLSVSNHGPPLPETLDGHLFDSMVSLRRGADEGEPHLGLGLYIVRLIAQFHGGSAEAANLRDGSGVVVSVTLPLAG